jgi:hypothetical protein
MRSIRVLETVLVGIILGASVYWGMGAIRERDQTVRTTAEFDPPVWAGQDVPGACSGGFYARTETTIVLTVVAHCGGVPGRSLHDGPGQYIGTYGPMAELTDCPTGRFCSPSDFMVLALAADRIPWGHLNMVDLGAGGYRTLVAGTRPLACGDINVGRPVELNGREHYRTGTVVATGPYQYATDTMFPCMVVTDIEVAVGDSGSAVLVDGLPAGITSRNVGGNLGFTPLAEGIENLGLTLCTTPDCDLSPDRAIQPEP